MNNQKLSISNKMTSRAITQHGKQDDTNNQQHQTHYHKQNPILPSGPSENSSVPPEVLQKAPSAFLSGHILPQGVHQRRQPFTNVSVDSSRIPFQVHNDNRPDNVCPPVQRYRYEKRSCNYNARRSPQRGTITYNPLNTQMERPDYHGNSDFNHFASPPRGQHHEQKQTC